MFSRSRNLARETAQRLLTGHTALLAYWALRHAGVLDEMRRSPEGLDPGAHARRTSMAPDVLAALVKYLAHAGLVAVAGNRATLTPAGRALYEHEDGVLELLRAYQPVLGALEHLLARLKTYGNGVSRKADALIASQAARYDEEVFPAIQRALGKSKATHLLDLNCGSGEFLMHLAQATPGIAGVGICGDGIAVRKANEAITARKIEKRFIAVTGRALDICTDTREAFDRLGISTTFWEKIDAVLACNTLAELAGQDATSTTAALARIPRAFPGATLILVEPMADARRDATYYAAELELLLGLSRQALLPAERWRDMLTVAGLKVESETPLATDNLCVFVCTPSKKKPEARSQKPE